MAQLSGLVSVVRCVGGVGGVGGVGAALGDANGAVEGVVVVGQAAQRLTIGSLESSAPRQCSPCGAAVSLHCLWEENIRVESVWYA